MKHGAKIMDFYNTATSLSEYLLIAMPDQTLVNGLKGFQETLVQKVYPEAEALPVRYLTLAGLMAKDYLEDTLSRWIMKVCRIKPSFRLSFEKDLKFSEGVLSLEIAECPEIRSFHLQLGVVDDFLSASDCFPLQLILKPQLPVLIPNRSILASDLTPSFNREFRITEIAMLKRNKFHDRFEKVNVFGLSSQG